MIYTAGSTAVSANAVSIIDAGGYYAAVEVEAALQEIVTRTGSLNTVVIDIGDWVMDSAAGGYSAFRTVPHGLPDFTKIRGISAVIRRDDDNQYHDHQDIQYLFLHMPDLQTYNDNNQ